MLTSSDNHIKIITKLQNNCHWKSTSWTKVLLLRIYRRRPSSPIGWVETCKKHIPNSHVVVKNQKKYLSCGGFCRRAKDASPSLGFKCLEEKTTKNLKMETSGYHDSVRKRAAGDPSILRKGPVHGFSQWQNRSELQHWGSRSKGIRDIWGGTVLSGFRARAGEVAFSKREVLTESVLFGEPSPSPA